MTQASDELEAYSKQRATDGPSAELARDLGDLVVLQQPQVLGDDLLGDRPLQGEVPDLQPQALLQIARGQK